MESLLKSLGNPWGITIAALGTIVLILGVLNPTWLHIGKVQLRFVGRPNRLTMGVGAVFLVIGVVVAVKKTPERSGPDTTGGGRTGGTEQSTVLFRDDFENGQLSPDWIVHRDRGSVSVVDLRGRGRCALIENDAALMHRLKPEACIGRRVRLSAWLRVRDIGPVRGELWKQATMHISWVTKDGTTQFWPEDEVERSFGNDSLNPDGQVVTQTSQLPVPDDIEYAEVYIGIQDNTGKLWVDDVEVSVID